MTAESHRHHADELTRLPESQLEALLNRQEADWRTGTSVAVETLLRDAGVGAYEKFDVDQLLTLICGEVLLRESLNQRPSLAEYELRFPLRHGAGNSMGNRSTVGLPIDQWRSTWNRSYCDRSRRSSCATAPDRDWPLRNFFRTWPWQYGNCV